jgi:hypothetical protein
MKFVLSRARKAGVRGVSLLSKEKKKKNRKTKSRLPRAAGDFFLHPRPMKPTGSGGK